MTDHPDRDALVDRLLKQTKPAPITDAHADCLDAETFAAWAAGALSGASVRQAEAHLATCARCGAMAAVFARTDDGPSLRAETAHARGWLRWFVPAAATAAAALTVWVLMPSGGERQAANTPAPPSQMAAARPETPPRFELESRAGERDLGALKDEARLDQTPSTVAAPSADAPVSEREGRQPADANAAPAAAPLAQETAQSRREATDTITPLARTAPTPAPMLSMESAVTERRIVSAASPAISWRILGNRRVQRTTDGGAGWHEAAVAATADLIAGASPAPTVCWIVGRAGAVFLTTDGTAWASRPAPVDADLVDVRALDAARATVTAADGRQFSTTDAGATWVAGPLQGF